MIVNTNHKTAQSTLPIWRKIFMGEVNGQAVYKIELDFGSGIKAAILNYGCILQKLSFPDQHGIDRELVRGFGSLEEYQQDQNYNATIVGRYANRIAQGRFSLNGENFQLSQNENQHHLHGGLDGLNRKVWQLHSIDQKGDKVHLEFSYQSPAGEQGYPGTVAFRAFFVFSLEGFELKITATTDAETPLNLTYHPYFNLNGWPKGRLADHQLRIEADSYLPVNAEKIPLADSKSVIDTPFDFRSFSSIKDQMEALPTGFDHCFELNGHQPVASAWAKESGIQLDIYSNQQALQLYTEDPSLADGATFCLEPQYFPDAPNHPARAEQSILKVGHEYGFEARYHFHLI